MIRAKKPQPPRQSPPPDVEARSAEVVTVAWMLSVMTSLMCELGTIAAAWLLASWPDSAPVAALEAVLFFSALVIGVVSLALCATVLRVRREAPPIGITIFAVVIGGGPLLVLLARFAMHWLRAA